MIIFISIISVIVVGFIIFLIWNLTQKDHDKYDDFIWENSVCLKKLKEINNRYHFYSFVNLNQNYTYDNKNFYDTISCTDYLIYQLRDMKNKVSAQIEKIHINEKLYPKYLNELKTITQFGQFESSIGKLKREKLIKKEKSILERQVSVPVTRFVITVTLCCSKMNGEVYCNKSKSFSERGVLNLIKRLNNKSGTFYNDREIWDAICRVERGKVSNKMRFSIYARDGYKCRKCGVSDRYADLEIDHIIPIAKGGKSTYDNLQTLCHECNKEKGDRLY